MRQTDRQYVTRAFFIFCHCLGRTKKMLAEYTTLSDAFQRSMLFLLQISPMTLTYLTILRTLITISIQAKFNSATPIPVQFISFCPHVLWNLTFATWKGGGGGLDSFLSLAAVRDTEGHHPHCPSTLWGDVGTLLAALPTNCVASCLLHAALHKPTAQQSVSFIQRGN